MTTLREEIDELTREILYNPPLPENWNNEINEHVDLLISKIEKRIDEMINNFEQQKKIPFKERPILIEHDLNLLRFVKEEILK